MQIKQIPLVSLLLLLVNFLSTAAHLGTRQPCEVDGHCATASCNSKLGVCQCQECSEDGCGGCETGQICLSRGDALNECKSNIEMKQVDRTLQEEQNNVTLVGTEQNETFYCGESYFEAVGNCTTGVQCPNGNSDCPEKQVCFGPFKCESSSDEEPLTLEILLQQGNQSSLALGNSSSGSLSANNSLPPLPPNTTLSSGSPLISGTSSNSPTVAKTDPPVTPVTMYCGESYNSAKETCSDDTACPGGYECPSGKTCYAGIKCFTRPPTNAPSGQPTTLPPSIPPTGGPSTNPTDSPVAPTTSPTHRPTRAPFDFSNEYFCGLNFTHAQETCYTTTPCPGGDPTDCKEGQTCYNGIKCIAPPSFSPTFTPTFKPSSQPVVSGDNVPSPAGGTGGTGSGSNSGGYRADDATAAPFVWEESSGKRIRVDMFVLGAGLYFAAAVQ